MPEPFAYRFLDPEKLAEVRALDGRIRELEARLEAELTREQQGLAFEYQDATAERWGEVHFAQMQAMVEHLAAHFPGIGPALKLVAGHCAWGSDIAMGCCDLKENGVGL